MNVDRNTDFGSAWLVDNFITSGRINNVRNIVVASEDQNAIRLTFADGNSGKLTVGNGIQGASQVVAAWKIYSGTAGSGAPTDPVSASANNLVTNAAANATVAKAKIIDSVNNAASMAGLPVWIFWIVGIVVLWFGVKWLWKKIKSRRRR